MKFNRLILLSVLFLGTNLTSCKGVRSPIVVLGAMPEEIDILINNLVDAHDEEIDGYEVKVGTINNYPVVIGRSGIGMLNASKSSEAIIKKYHPYCLIDQGTAGGHTTDDTVGSIVLGEEIKNITYYWDYSKETQEPELTPLYDDPKYTLKSDIALVNIANNVEYKVEGHPEYKLIKDGTLGSSDEWNDKETIKKLQAKLPTNCEDMENYSVASSCDEHIVPFLGLRVVSNNAVIGGEYEDYKVYAKYSQQYTIDVVKAIIQKNLA